VRIYHVQICQKDTSYIVLYEMIPRSFSKTNSYLYFAGKTNGYVVCNM
jgi:hypothetical protein